MSSRRRRIGVAFSLARYHYGGGEKKRKNATSAQGLEYYFSLVSLVGWGLRYFLLPTLVVEPFPWIGEGREKLVGLYEFHQISLV